MDIIKKYKVIITIGLIILIIFGFVFYWVSMRPVQIRKNCSWVTEVIPADSGITKEQAEENKIIYNQECNNINQIKDKVDLAVKKVQCQLLEKNNIERDPQPEKIEKNKATDEEYKSCLREHGLIK